MQVVWGADWRARASLGVRCDAMPASCAGLLEEAKAALHAVLRHGAMVSDTVITKALLGWSGREKSSRVYLHRDADKAVKTRSHYIGLSFARISTPVINEIGGP
jgi:hypothetical protein